MVSQDDGRRDRRKGTFSALNWVERLAGTALLLSAFAMHHISAGAQESAHPVYQDSSSGVGQGVASRSADPGGEPYLLQAGDELTIKVFNRPELEETIRIRPDGKISVLLIDDVQAAGLRPPELDEQLTARYAGYFRDPEVTVIVRSFANQKVYVGGEVAQPGVIELSGELTALGAVLRAGGFNRTARTDSVILLRDTGADRPRVNRVNLKDVLHKGAPDVVLEPFDVVFVPMTRIAQVDKFVDQYIRQLVPLTLTAGFTYILGGKAVIVP